MPLPESYTLSLHDALPIFGVTNQIDSLTDLSKDEKDKFKNQAQEAHDRAVAKVDGATADQIDTEKNTGLVDINKALSDAKLQAAKNKAKSDLDQAAIDAGKNDPTDQDAINNERDKAKDKIDQSDTIDKVNKAKEEGQSAIMGIEQTGKDRSEERRVGKECRSRLARDH